MADLSVSLHLCLRSALVLACESTDQQHMTHLWPFHPDRVLACLQLIMEVITQLEGAFSLLIKSSRYPGELVACKRGSPLILGIKEAVVRRRSSGNDGSKRAADSALECFVASDASAVVEHTKQCAPVQFIGAGSL